MIFFGHKDPGAHTPAKAPDNESSVQGAHSAIEKTQKAIAENFIQQDTNAKEILDIPQEFSVLEDENLKIDSIGWRETTDSNGLPIKINATKDVREYLEGDLKGEQLFTHKAALREAALQGKQLPASADVYQSIIDKKYGGDYKKFLVGERIRFSGRRIPMLNIFVENSHEDINDNNERFFLRCADKSYFHGDARMGKKSIGGKDYGFSVRCLKM